MAKIMGVGECFKIRPLLDILRDSLSERFKWSLSNPDVKAHLARCDVCLNYYNSLIDGTYKPKYDFSGTEKKILILPRR